MLFYGGEWEQKNLVHFLEVAKGMGYKTCLYTGMDSVSKEIKKQLTYLKTGPYMKRCGSLSSPTTNQKFIKVTSDKNMTHRFTKRS